MEVRRQFSLRAFFCVVSLLAIFLAGRAYVFAPATSMPAVVIKAHIVCVSMALIVAIAVAMTVRRHSIKSAIIVSLLAATTAMVCAVVLGVEISEGVRSQYPDYFQWPGDAVIVVKQVLLIGCLGAVVGLFSVALVTVVRRFRRTRS